MQDFSSINISIVGFGNVGRSILYLLLQDHHHKFNINISDPSEYISGSVMDLTHASMLSLNHMILVNDAEAFSAADFVFFCAGQAIPRGMGRDYALEENRAIVKQVFRNTKFKNQPTIITISNPLDALAYDIFTESGLPANAIIGVGTLIETIRLRNQLSQMAGVDASLVNTLVIGEHGDTMVPVLSQSTIAGKPVREVLHPELIRDCIYETRRAPHRIKLTQGASFYAAASASVWVLGGLLKSELENIPLSVYHPKDHVFYSMPVNVTSTGWHIDPIDLDPLELEALQVSVAKIQSYSTPLVA